MRQLRDDTNLRLDGEVQVYRRKRSKRCQAAFVIDGQTTIRPVEPPCRISGAKNEKCLCVPAGLISPEDPCSWRQAECAPEAI